jgi:hypothetical protein
MRTERPTSISLEGKRRIAEALVKMADPIYNPDDEDVDRLGRVASGDYFTLAYCFRIRFDFPKSDADYVKFCRRVDELRTMERDREFQEWRDQMPDIEFREGDKVSCDGDVWTVTKVYHDEYTVRLWRSGSIMDPHDANKFRSMVAFAEDCVLVDKAKESSDR